MVDGVRPGDPLKTSCLVSGAGLIVFGVLRAATHREWPLWACGAIGLWIIGAPGLLGYGTRGVAVDEALWTGLVTLGLVGLVAVDVRFGATARPDRGGRAPGRA